MAHDFRTVRSTWEDWLTVVHIGLSAAIAAGDPAGEGWMLQSRCAVYARFGRAEETIEDAERSLAIAGKVGDVRLTAVCLTTLATVHFDQSRFAEALAGYEKALELAAGNPAIEAHAYNNIAQVRHALGRPRAALEPQRRAVELYRAVGEFGFASFAVANLAELHTELGELDDAERHAREAVDLAAGPGLVLQEAFGREILARILRTRGLTAAARAELERSAELYAQVRSGRVEQIRVLLAEPPPVV
jgi:tetratricopeptide (TPR) repeat protein